MRAVVVQEWLESEAGWGCRPDGFSVHLTVTDCKEYCKKYWEDEKKRNKSGGVPHEYSRECGEPQLVDVEDKVYDALVKAKKKNQTGIRVWCRDIKKISSDSVFALPLDKASDYAANLAKNVKSTIYVWHKDEAPEALLDLAGVAKFTYVSYIPRRLSGNEIPLKRAAKTILLLKDLGSVKFYK